MGTEVNKQNWTGLRAVTIYKSPQSRIFGIAINISYNNRVLHSRLIYIYTGCNRRNGSDFGRMFLMLYYTDITQNTYIQS